MDTRHEILRQRFLTTLDLFEAGCQMKRMSLKRQHPDLGPEELERLLAAWLSDKELPLAGVPGFRVREASS